MGMNNSNTYEMTMTKRNYILSKWCDKLRNDPKCDRSLIPRSPTVYGIALTATLVPIVSYIHIKTGMWILATSICFATVPVCSFYVHQRNEQQWNVFLNRHFKLLPEDLQEGSLNFDDKILDKYLPEDFNYKKAVKQIKTRFEIETADEDMEEEHH